MSAALQKSHWEQFGTWIRQMRREHDLPQKDVADGAGLHEVQYARIEKGHSGTKRETVIAIARSIGVDESLALNKAGFASVDELPKSGLIVPPFPKRPKNVVDFLDMLSSIGEFSFAFDRDELDKYTEDDFQALLERIKADVEITVRRKNR